MKSVVCILVMFFLLIGKTWSSPAFILNDENLPPEFEATYDIYKGNMHVGKMEVSLKNFDDELIYESIINPIGIAALFLGDQEVTDRAVLRLVGERYKTIEFKHEIKGSEKNRNEHYIFNWNYNKADVQYKDRNNTLDISPHTFDNFSAQLLLMREPNVEITEYTYSVISKGRLKDYVYTLEPNESISTKLGEFTANKYVRKKNNKKKTIYLGWYAEHLNYIPVRLDKIKNGKIDTSIQITKVNWL